MLLWSLYRDKDCRKPASLDESLTCGYLMHTGCWMEPYKFHTHLCGPVSYVESTPDQKKSFLFTFWTDRCFHCSRGPGQHRTLHPWCHQCFSVSLCIRVSTTIHCAGCARCWGTNRCKWSAPCGWVAILLTDAAGASSVAITVSACSSSSGKQGTASP